MKPREYSPTVPKMPSVPNRKGDVFLCSYPGSGRTWAKQFLAQYLSLLFDLGYTVKFRRLSLLSIVPSEWYLAGHPKVFAYADDLRVPRIRFAHYHFGPLFVDMPVIWFTRGILDTLVSHYYDTARDRSPGNFVRAHIGVIIEWLNGWWRGLPRTERYLHITYEALKEDSAREFRAVIDFIGLEYHPQHFREALRRASFKQMKEDQEDTPSKRVRKGIVGGYRTELSEDDIQFVQDTVRRKLDAEVWDVFNPLLKRSKA